MKSSRAVARGGPDRLGQPIVHGDRDPRVTVILAWLIGDFAHYRRRPPVRQLTEQAARLLAAT